MSLIDPRPAFRLTGWHVLAGFVLFFGVTFAVDTVMMVQAYKTFPGEVATSPYEDGLAYDSQLDQQRSQTALGWRMTADIAEPGLIRIQAFDRAGAPIPALHVSGRLERPATEQGRRDLIFAAAAPGVYEAKTAALLGAWDLRFSAVDRQGRRFEGERRLVAP